MDIFGPKKIYTFTFNNNDFILIGDYHEKVVINDNDNDKISESEFVSKIFKNNSNCNLFIEMPFSGKGESENTDLEIVKINNKFKNFKNKYNIDIWNSIFTENMNIFKFVFMLVRICEYSDKYKIKFYKKLRKEFYKISEEKIGGDHDDYLNVKRLIDDENFYISNKSNITVINLDKKQDSPMNILKEKNKGLLLYKYFINKYGADRFIYELTDNTKQVSKLNKQTSDMLNSINKQINNNTNIIIIETMKGDSDYYLPFLPLNDIYTIYKIFTSKKNAIIVIGYIHANVIITLIKKYIKNLKEYY